MSFTHTRAFSGAFRVVFTWSINLSHLAVKYYPNCSQGLWACSGANFMFQFDFLSFTLLCLCLIFHSHKKTQLHSFIFKLTFQWLFIQTESIAFKVDFFFLFLMWVAYCTKGRHLLVLTAGKGEGEGVERFLFHVLLSLPPTYSKHFSSPWIISLFWNMGIFSNSFEEAVDKWRYNCLQKWVCGLLGSFS